MTIFLDLEPTTSASLAAALACDVAAASTSAAARGLLETGQHDLVVVGPDADPSVAFELADGQRRAGTPVGVVLLTRRVTSALLREAMVAGVRDVVAAEDLPAVAEACRRSQEVSRQLHRGSEGLGYGAGTSGQLVTVFAAKGGCGKTTVATNLATCLAQAGKRTCLLDLDLAFGDVAIALQLEPVRTLADALALSSLDETALRSLVTTHASGLDTILAPVNPGTAESIPVTLVGDLLDLLKSLYDVVVVDSPPAFTEHVLAAFDRSDAHVLLTTLDVAALKNLKLTLETLTMLGYPNEHRHVVLNRSDARVGLSLQDVERTLGSKVGLQVPSSRAVPASINRGVPIVLDQPNHPVSVGLRRFSQQFGPQTTQRAPRRSIIRLRRNNEVPA
jgi:pilus assembly protein CpaE